MKLHLFANSCNLSLFKVCSSLTNQRFFTHKSDNIFLAISNFDLLENAKITFLLLDREESKDFKETLLTKYFFHKCLSVI